MTTTDLTPIEKTAELEQLAMHRAKIADEIKNLDTIRKELDEKIVALAGTSTTAGPYKVTITRPLRLDTAKLEAAFPVVTHPELYKRAIDTAAVKDRISKHDLTAYQVEGSPSVRIS